MIQFRRRWTKEGIEMLDVKDGYHAVRVSSRWENCFDKVKEHLKTGIKRVYGLHEETEDIAFHCKDDYIVVMYHEQDCCEQVYLDSCDSVTNGVDIYTDCDWCEIEEVSSEGCGSKTYGARSNGEPWEDDSFTWTFYKLKTNKGYDNMRWYGCSNGYYSESVDFAIYRMVEDNV